MNKFSLLLATAAVFASSSSSVANAANVFVGFDIAQAGYTPTPGTIQNVTNQFGSLGIIFRDQKTVGQGATLGRCGPGNGAVAFFGFGSNAGGTCGDFRPNIDIDFVNPSNNALDGYTTAFSILNFDGVIKATAYDGLGAILGTTQNFSGVLSLSGIGNISRVNLQSVDQDPTTLDDLNFEAVIGVAGAVPEPATWLMMIFGFGLVGGAMRYRQRQPAKVTFG